MPWYYYNENKEEIGPVTNSELRQRARSGVVTPETFVKDSRGRTGRAEDIKDKEGNGLPFTNIYEAASIPALLDKAESGDTAAMRTLAMTYFKGDGVDPDVEEAERWLERAAKLGDAESQSTMAGMLRTGNRDVNRAFYWEQKAAEQGFSLAQHNLAVCFQNGIGTSVNPERMFYWYQKAAENGYTESKRILARCYVRGDGIPQDLEKAVYWLQQASDEGDAEAKKMLGAAYIEGMGCSVDNIRGLSLLREAASLGNENAKELLISDEVLDIITRENATPEQLRALQARDEARLTAAKARLKKEGTIMAIGGVIGGGIMAILCGVGSMANSSNIGQGLAAFLFCGMFGGLCGVYFGIGFGACFGFIKTVYRFLWDWVPWRLISTIIGANPIVAIVIFLIGFVWVLLVFLPYYALVAPVIAIYRYVQHYQYVKHMEQSKFHVWIKQHSQSEHP